MKTLVVRNRIAQTLKLLERIRARIGAELRHWATGIYSLWYLHIHLSYRMANYFISQSESNYLQNSLIPSPENRLISVLYSIETRGYGPCDYVSKLYWVPNTPQTLSKVN
jgi:hypothetical protein